MGGSGYRPSRDTVAALYGAVRDWPMLRHNSDGISLPYCNGKSPANLPGQFVTVWQRNPHRLFVTVRQYTFIIASSRLGRGHV